MNRQGRPGEQKTREECSKNLERSDRARCTEGVHVNVVSQRHERNDETLSLDMQLKEERVTRDRSTTARQTVRIDTVNDGGNKKYRTHPPPKIITKSDAVRPNIVEEVGIGMTAGVVLGKKLKCVGKSATGRVANNRSERAWTLTARRTARKSAIIDNTQLAIMKKDG